MQRPDYNEFLSLAQGASLVPVVKSVSADLLTPVSAYLAIAAGEKHAFLLESVEGGEKVGRYTFLGVRPYMLLTAYGDKITVQRDRKKETLRANPFKFLQELLQEHTIAELPGLPPLACGAVGFFSYDAVRQLEAIPSRAKADVSVPDCALMFFDRLLAFDHVRHQIHIIAAADVRREVPQRAYDRALRDIAAIEKKLTTSKFPRTCSSSRADRDMKVKSATSEKEFLTSVKRAKEYIGAGDVFQVVLSQRMELSPGSDAFSIYRVLRTINPSPYMYFLRMDGLDVLGASPETLVKVRGRELNYRPIAGTRPRGNDEMDDRRLEEELRADKKENAEHVMLVDLGRNDVGKVSEYGSVKVRELMIVERYSHVMHLVSAIEGTLRSGLDALDAFAACFPAGTLTGAPKVRAMQIIEELEPVRRGIYGGSVLYADFAGNLDSCIAIRTMLIKNGKAYLQAGAGVVADSDPQKEFEECRNKAQALLRAAQLARRPSSS